MSSSAPASASTRRAVTRSRPKLIKFYSPETAVKYKLMMQSENELSFYRDDIRAFVDLLGLASPAAPRSGATRLWSDTLRLSPPIPPVV